MANTVDKVLKIAEGEVGYLEKKSNAQLDDKTANAGAENYTKYWRDLAPGMQRQPWCNAFVNYVFLKAYGETAAKQLLCTSGAWSYYTPTSAGYFKTKWQWLTAAPKAGDVIYFKNTERIYHVGLVYKVDSKYVYTIEGNTSSGDNNVVANGGGVFKKKYELSYSRIAGYGRPKYDESQISDETPVKSGIKGIRTTTASLNIRRTPNGDICGSYGFGSLVKATARTKFEDGVCWLKSDRGWVSSKYCEGWLRDDSGNTQWYYIADGRYMKSEWRQIDKVWYAFDRNGYMVSGKYVKSADKNIWYWIENDGSWNTKKDVDVKPDDSKIAAL